MHDIDVYGTIGSGGWLDDEGVTAKQLIDALREANGDDVCIHVNSGGGDVFDAQAMSESIRAYDGHVTASIEGLAASAASFFALTADEVVMNPSALVMVHNPSTYAMGDAKDMRAAAERLDKVRGTIVRTYTDKTGKDAETVGAWMDAETWMDANEAIANGLVDSLTDAKPIAAYVSKDVLSAYQNAPKGLEPHATAESHASADPITSDEQLAGEPEPTTFEDEKATESEAGKVGVEATPKAFCVAGTFLRA